MSADRAATRRALLDAVERVRPAVSGGADEAERLRTLPASTVTALRDSGLLALKLPAVLGGAEADPVSQIEPPPLFQASPRQVSWPGSPGPGTV